ncbi:MAG: NAD(P)-binding domain-containing protein, partial [Desulfosalsimonas sp.]
MKKYVIVGCGRLGTSLARYLAEAGYRPAGFASRSIASAKRAAAAAGSDVPVSVLPWEVTENADIVIITTPDGIIRETADKIAEYEGVAKGAVVLHCSGAHSSTELEAVKKCGASIG